MKFKLIINFGIALLISCFLWSCGTFHHTAGHSGKIPPGQAKKMYGHKSARDFAPGHNK